MTTRGEAKEATRRRLIEAARAVIADQGAAALTLREIASRAGVVPSAVYRHLDNRDELLTLLVLESYLALAEALESAPRGRSPWRSRSQALRSWAKANPHEFQLLYGTPVPGYAAPPETIPAAGRVAAAFLLAAPSDPPVVSGALRKQLSGPARDLGSDPQVLAWTLAALAQLVGLLLLELGGHFVGIAEPADLLWDDVVGRQTALAST